MAVTSRIKNIKTFFSTVLTWIINVISASDSMYLLLSGVNIPQSDVHEVPRGEERLHPGEPWDVWHLWWTEGDNFGSPEVEMRLKMSNSVFFAMIIFYLFSSFKTGYFFYFFYFLNICKNRCYFS